MYLLKYFCLQMMQDLQNYLYFSVTWYFLASGPAVVLSASFNTSSQKSAQATNKDDNHVF